MNEKQKARNEDTIKALIAEILVRRVKDPRLSGVSITGVEASKDYSVAKVLYNVLEGGARDIASVQKGLNSSRRYIRAEIKKRLRLRVIPELVFIYDRSLDRAMKIEELLEQLRREAETREEKPENG